MPTNSTIKFLQSVELTTVQGVWEGRITSANPNYLAQVDYVNSIAESLNPLLSPGQTRALAPTAATNISFDPISKSQLLLSTNEEQVFLDTSMPFGTIINSATPNLGFVCIPLVASMQSSTNVFISTHNTRYFNFTTSPASNNPPATYTSFTSINAQNPNNQQVALPDAAYLNDSTLLNTKIVFKQFNIMGVTRPYYLEVLEIPYSSLRAEGAGGGLDTLPSALRVGVFSTSTIRINTTIQLFHFNQSVMSPTHIMLTPLTQQHGTFFAVLSSGVFVDSGELKGFAVITSPTLPSIQPPAPGATVKFIVAYY